MLMYVFWSSVFIVGISLLAWCSEHTRHGKKLIDKVLRLLE